MPRPVGRGRTEGAKRKKRKGEGKRIEWTIFSGTADKGRMDLGGDRVKTALSTGVTPFDRSPAGVRTEIRPESGRTKPLKSAKKSQKRDGVS